MTKDRDKIIIKENPNGDTRTADRNNLPTFEEFHDANESHIDDVKRVMFMLSNECTRKGWEHDFTKFSREREFYSDFLKTITDDPSIPGAFNFEEGDWYKMHVAAERHHLDKSVPEDVNLLDVIEMIVDRVCAAKARGGSYDYNISDYLLQRAYFNTYELINSMTEVEGEKWLYTTANVLQKFLAMAMESVRI